MSPRYVVVALALLSAGAQAQAPGNCEIGRAEADLDVGDVLARVFNTGSLFFGNSSEAAYLVPRLSNRSPMFAAGIWVGGLVAGELRVAGATYADFEFWPGPIDPETRRPPDPSDCSAYDRIWRVSRGDIEHYYRTGLATADLAEWPHELGAPVFDGDGVSGNYDLAAGDQPAISGDQMVWWVMNDMGNTHRNSLTRPIGLEAQVTAFAFASGPLALRQATFYRYRFVNRGANALDTAYVGFFADPDLGDASDDYVGSDTLRDMAFVYNGDEVDGTGTGSTYGPSPPAFGILVVPGPVGLPNDRDDNGDGTSDESGERIGLSAFISWFDAAFPQNDPPNGPAMYQNLKGRWVDGTPITVGGSGLNQGSTDTTTVMFAGDATTSQYWSEECNRLPWQSICQPDPPGDRRFMMSTGPFRLEAGGSDEVQFALLFARAEDRLGSVIHLRATAGVVRNAFDAGYLDPRPVPGFDGPPAPPAAVQIRRPAPNPFTENAVLSLSLPDEAGVRVALVDVLGREVAVLTDGPRDAGAHQVAIDGAAMAPGVYVIRVWVDGQAAAALPLTRR